MTKRWRFFMLLKPEILEAPDSWEGLSLARRNPLYNGMDDQELTIKGTRNTIEVWAGERMLGFADVSILPDEEYNVEISDIGRGSRTLHLSIRGKRCLSDGIIEKPSWWNSEMLVGWESKEGHNSPFDLTNVEFATTIPQKRATYLQARGFGEICDELRQG